MNKTVPEIPRGAFSTDIPRNKKAANILATGYKLLQNKSEKYYTVLGWKVHCYLRWKLAAYGEKRSIWNCKAKANKFETTCNEAKHKYCTKPDGECTCKVHVGLILARK